MEVASRVENFRIWEAVMNIYWKTLELKDQKVTYISQLYMHACVIEKPSWMTFSGKNISRMKITILYECIVRILKQLIFLSNIFFYMCLMRDVFLLLSTFYMFY